MAAIVHGDRQNLNRVYESDQALRQGTLFPELDKPMCDQEPCHTCVSCEQAADFAAWEVRLYLNTHPCDRSAQALYRHYCQEYEDCDCQERQGCGYACLCCCDQDDCDCQSGCCSQCTRWRWTQEPWPWEYCEEEGD